MAPIKRLRKPECDAGELRLIGAFIRVLAAERIPASDLSVPAFRAQGRCATMAAEMPVVT